MDADKTRIEVTKGLRDALTEQKRGNDTMETVIQRLLDHYKATHNGVFP